MASAEGHNYSQEELLTLLIRCINQRSRLKDLNLVLKAGADPNGAKNKGLRPLHYAAYENFDDAVQMLLNYGAYANIADDIGYTPLHLACKHGHIESAKVLLLCNAKINFDDSQGTSGALSDLTVNPLSLAVEYDHPDLLKLLLDNGAKVNQQYFLGSELNNAPMENVRCIELLLKHGAEPDAVSRGGLTPLMKACKHRHLPSVKALIKHGANVNLQCPPRFDQRNALHFAAISGDPEICRVLLENGAYTTKPDNYDVSPLELAICQDNVECCEILLVFGADPNELNADKCNPLQVAVSAMGLHRRMEIIEVLLKHKANPNASSEKFSYVAPSLSPLVEYFSYLEEYDIQVVRLLLQYGAKVTMRRPTRLLRIKDSFGVLGQLRKLRPYEDIFSLLVEASSHFDLEDISHESSLSNGQREVLIEVGSAPIALRHLARLSIRDIIGQDSPAHVTLLPIPNFLQEYLLYKVF